MIVVIDASVVLRWLLEDPAREPDTEKALALIESVVSGRLQVLQPVHWLADVAAVAARLAPQTAVRDVEMLAAPEFPTADDPNIIRRQLTLLSRPISIWLTRYITQSRLSTKTLWC